MSKLLLFLTILTIIIKPQRMILAECILFLTELQVKKKSKDIVQDTKNDYFLCLSVSSTYI